MDVSHITAKVFEDRNLENISYIDLDEIISNSHKDIYWYREKVSFIKAKKLLLISFVIINILGLLGIILGFIYARNVIISPILEIFFLGYSFIFGYDLYKAKDHYKTVEDLDKHTRIIFKYDFDNVLKPVKYDEIFNVINGLIKAFSIIVLICLFYNSHSHASFISNFIFIINAIYLFAYLSFIEIYRLFFLDYKMLKFEDDKYLGIVDLRTYNVYDKNRALNDFNIDITKGDEF